jgi:hypothetical protein
MSLELFIMPRLRWMENSFWMYLRDTGIIHDKHCNILRAASQEVIDLIAGSLANTHNLAGMSTVQWTLPWETTLMKWTNPRSLIQYKSLSEILFIYNRYTTQQRIIRV